MTAGDDFRISGREVIADLGFLEVTKRTVESPNGASFRRIVIEHPGAAAVVPFAGDDVILIRQYRAPIDRRILEIPAGKLDQVGEDPRDAARRELVEETGYVGGSFVHLTDLWTAVGFCDERISIFSTDVVDSGERDPIGPEEIDAEVVRIPLDDAVDLVRTGEIADAKTVVGILIAARDRGAS